MSEITLEKNHALLEKLANYVMTEVPTKREMNDRFEKVDLRLTQVEQRLNGVEHRLFGVEGRMDGFEQRIDHLEGDMKLILEGMDSQVQEMEIFRTEQVSIKVALSRLEKP